MCLGRKNWKKGGVVAMVGLECDDDNCDWIKGKSNRRRSGVQTEIGDNFSLRFFGLVSRRRGWIVWLRMYHVELQRFKILGQVFSATCGSSKRHTAPCAISSALGRPSLLVQSATFWAMCGRSKWHTTPCAIWSAFGRLLFQVRYVLLACQRPESAAFSLKTR